MHTMNEVDVKKLRSDSRLVEIVWIDSAGHNGWMDEDQILLEVSAASYQLCITVGYVIIETPKFYLLAPSLASGSYSRSRLLNDSISIPKVAVKSVSDLSRRRSS
jgi:hypothetical protein